MMMEGGFYSRLASEPKVLFGGHPSQAQCDHLRTMGVRYFIDLTTPHEKRRLQAYDYKDAVYVNFPIRDNFIPCDMDLFNEFLVWLVFTIGVMRDDELMYVHCKGGHGRSGMVACCVLCAGKKLTPEQSVMEVTRSHHERPLLTPKWRKQLCPPNEVQRVFIGRVSEHHNAEKAATTHTLEKAFNVARKRMLTRTHSQPKLMS